MAARTARRKVLPDDEYERRLQQIVEQTYTPRLAQMRKLDEALDAELRGDKEAAAALRAEAERMTSEADADIPTGRGTHVIGTVKGAQTLESFFAKNVAEETLSLGVLRAKDIREHRATRGWLYKNPEAPPGVAAIEAPASAGGSSVAGTAPAMITSGQAGAGALPRSAGGALVTTARGTARARDAAPQLKKVINVAGLRPPGADELMPPPQGQGEARAASLASQGTYRSDGEVGGVVNTPLIRPGSGGGDTPIVTWGALDATPLVLERSGSATPYRIPEEDPRERMARKLAASAAKSRAQRSSGSTVPENTPLHAKLLARAGITPSRTPLTQTPTPRAAATPLAEKRRADRDGTSRKRRKKDLSVAP